MAEKRDKIIESAIRLFEQNGFWNTSTASISKEAGIAAGTLFRYFPSKEQLIDELFLELKTEVADCMYQNLNTKLDVQARLKHIWKAYIHWNLQNPGKFTILEQLEVASRISRSVQNQVVSLNQFTVKTFQEGKKAGLIGNYPVEFLANFMGSSSNNVIRQLLSQERKPATKATQAKLAELGFEVFWNGISQH